MNLTNNIISVEVAEYGAELVSLKKGDREYMWNGDPAFWNRHAPILFPAVGKPYNNELHIDGKVYTMKQHGFARDSEFVAVGDGRLRMVDTDRPEQYPYKFSLEAEYRLVGSSVEITWTVVNRDLRDMYFQIGAHPGFILPDYELGRMINGYVRYYDKEDNLVAPVVTSFLDDGNRVPPDKRILVPKEMPLMPCTFIGDALIFEGGQVAKTELWDRHCQPVLNVSCPQAEAFGVWAPHKEGYPFVCLEPWCGICDAKGFTGDISERTYSHRLAPEEQYQFTYTINIY